MTEYVTKTLKKSPEGPNMGMKQLPDFQKLLLFKNGLFARFYGSYCETSLITIYIIY